MKYIGIVQYPGSNCVEDTVRYFADNTTRVFLIWHKDVIMPKQLDLLVIPGGFAFGDRFYEQATSDYNMNPGKMAVSSPVTSIIQNAHKQNIPILGICNGFQILIHLGLLPGQLLQNKSRQFCSKRVDCIIHDKSIQSPIKYPIPIANEYGRYVATDLNQLIKHQQILMTYEHYDNHSSKFGGKCIAGVCNKERNVFGMMPHPERCYKKHIPGIKSLLLSIFFQNTIKHTIKHRVKRLMTSEHISYKSTKQYLATLHTKESWVVQGPGENAGIVDIGDGYCLALRIESHNHPTYIDPYNGAATGVGGIIRDIIAMGARPIALLDFLRFGIDNNAPILLKEAIHGIADYGNTNRYTKRWWPSV